MATAYPDRVNLRGTWMRQLLYTMVCTLVLYKVVFTDYKVNFEVCAVLLVAAVVPMTCKYLRDVGEGMDKTRASKRFPCTW